MKKINTHSLAEDDRIDMATRNPTLKEEKPKRKPKLIKIERETTFDQETPPVHIEVKSQVKKKAQIRSVYVEVGANLGQKQLKFGITADINDEDAADVKNRLYFECLGSLERHIKEMGSENGPFRSR